jgi:hypothetical protein
MWILKETSDENQTECHQIEPNPSRDKGMRDGDNPSFWEEFTNYFLDSSVHIRILKQVPKYLATGLWRPSGTNSPPAEASTKGLKCKTNTLAILMHQILILTTQVSSVMLRWKKLEIWKKNVKTERAVAWKSYRVPWKWAKSVEG